MSGEDDDARLTAFIDGELDESGRAAIEARLAAEPDLRTRLARLREGNRPFAAAFALLLDEAPSERLQASLSAREVGAPAVAPHGPPWRFHLRRLAAAAAVIVLFCAGIAVGRLWPGDAMRSSENWRQAVAEYMDLYTADTFAAAADPQSGAVAALGAKLGLDLTPQRVALADLQFKGAQIFDYDGAPLGQLAYLDADAGPVLFCIIHDSEPDAAMKTGKRGRFAVASWARGGHGFMLIGRLPGDQMAALAGSLERRF